MIELEEEGAYGTITVQNYVQVAEEEKIYGDDFQENDMLNDILSNEIEREPERAEQLVRTLASLKKNLRIPSKRF